MQGEFTDLIVAALMVGMTITIGMAAYQLSRPTVMGNKLNPVLGECQLRAAEYGASILPGSEDQISTF